MKSAEIGSLGKISIQAVSFDAIKIHYILKRRFHSVYTDYDARKNVTDDGLDLDKQEWYSFGPGVMRSEETNFKARLLTVTELTKIKKN